jgi:hypothetical protein
VAIRSGTNGTYSTGAELCSLGAPGNSGCAEAAPVEGTNVHGLFDRDPGAVVSGTFIARVENGSLVDLTRVPEPEIDGRQTR